MSPNALGPSWIPLGLAAVEEPGALQLGMIPVRRSGSLGSQNCSQLNICMVYTAEVETLIVHVVVEVHL